MCQLSRDLYGGICGARGLQCLEQALFFFPIGQVQTRVPGGRPIGWRSADAVPRQTLAGLEKMQEGLLSFLAVDRVQGFRQPRRRGEDAD
jgi:hypothetical protein